MADILGFLYNIASFIIVITVIVFIHEFGHYLVARFAGVKIEVFSIGFGKEIFGWFDKHNTRWKICLIPLGGYVKMFGDKGEASTPDYDKIKKLTEQEKKLAFHTKSLPWKMAIVAAGPIANYILAIIIMTFLFTYYGVPISEPIIAKVEKHSAAEKAGIKAGDLILEVDNKKIEKFIDIQKIISLNKGEPIKVIINRDDNIYEMMVAPDIIEEEDMLGNLVKKSKLGIMSGKVTVERLQIHTSFLAAMKETCNISIATLEALGQMVVGKRTTEELGGPIRIAKYSGQSAKKGFSVIMWFIAVLSINLGLINLFPIPTLDGGHLFYYIIEAIRGRSISEKIQQIGFQIGLFLLIMLFIFAIFNDLKNLKLF